MWRSVPLNDTAISGLQPATEYEITLGLTGYNYYSNNRVMFQTHGALSCLCAIFFLILRRVFLWVVASRPVAPTLLSQVGGDEMSAVLQWDLSCDNGDPVRQFCLVSRFSCLRSRNRTLLRQFVFVL